MRIKVFSGRGRGRRRGAQSLPVFAVEYTVFCPASPHPAFGEPHFSIPYFPRIKVFSGWGSGRRLFQKGGLPNVSPASLPFQPDDGVGGGDEHIGCPLAGAHFDVHGVGVKGGSQAALLNDREAEGFLDQLAGDDEIRRSGRFLSRVMALQALAAARLLSRNRPSGSASCSRLSVTQQQLALTSPGDAARGAPSSPGPRVMPFTPAAVRPMQADVVQG